MLLQFSRCVEGVYVGEGAEKGAESEILKYSFFFFFKEIHVLLFIYLFIYDCVESLFLCEGFL